MAVPTPSKVRLCGPVMASPAATSKVSVPASTWISEAAASVSKPVNWLESLTLTTAPPKLIPAPATLSGSAIATPPLISRAAPVAIVVPLEEAPSAALLATCKTPLLMLVAPVYVFAPVNVSVPDPTFTNEPNPEITPEKVVLVLAAPTLSMLSVVLRTTDPPPDSDPIVSAPVLDRRNVAVGLTVKAEASAIDPAAEMRSSPPS